MPDFTWDKTERVYKLDGTTVPPSDIRSWLLGFIGIETKEKSKGTNASETGYGPTVRDLTQQLIDGKINLPAWQIAMESAIKSSRTDAALLAYGGKDAMTPQLWGRVGAEVREQYKYLNAFALGVMNEDIAKDGRMLSRAELYISGTYAFFENSKARREQDAGATEERRVLTPGNNCDDCTDAAAQDWQPIGTLPEIGDSQCMANCHCEFEHRGTTPEGSSDDS